VQNAEAAAAAAQAAAAAAQAVTAQAEQSAETARQQLHEGVGRAVFFQASTQSPCSPQSVARTGAGQEIRTTPWRLHICHNKLAGCEVLLNQLVVDFSDRHLTTV
jgi:hypothetical protein